MFRGHHPKRTVGMEFYSSDGLAHRLQELDGLLDIVSIMRERFTRHGNNHRRKTLIVNMIRAGKFAIRFYFSSCTIANSLRWFGSGEKRFDELTSKNKFADN